MKATWDICGTTRFVASGCGTRVSDLPLNLNFSATSSRLNNSPKGASTMITLPALASVTATTRDEGEFMRMIDWCYDVAKVSSWVAAGCEDGIHVIRLTLPEDDVRLDRFASQVEGRLGWSVERWP
jgi:hypothetical protein